MEIEDILDEVLLPGWDRLPGSDDRRAFARDEVCPVYDLVSQCEIAEAKRRWIQITREARTRLGHIILNDPDSNLQEYSDERLIMDALCDVINHLFRSTNNEPLQMSWRDVTQSLFCSE
ncbi:hypothetical protein KKC44_01760 [Patescibacteria group bacterium]|nr:hypothetical protein [Patescibacteria group bacterium]MBU2259308.1 hypothetical protein [Patescibacteria group bacterium]